MITITVLACSCIVLTSAASVPIHKTPIAPAQNGPEEELNELNSRPRVAGEPGKEYSAEYGYSPMAMDMIQYLITRIENSLEEQQQQQQQEQQQGHQQHQLNQALDESPNSGISVQVKEAPVQAVDLQRNAPEPEKPKEVQLGTKQGKVDARQQAQADFDEALLTAMKYMNMKKPAEGDENSSAPRKAGSAVKSHVPMFA